MNNMDMYEGLLLLVWYKAKYKHNTIVKVFASRTLAGCRSALQKYITEHGGRVEKAEAIGCQVYSNKYGCGAYFPAEVEL